MLAMNTDSPFPFVMISMNWLFDSMSTTEGGSAVARNLLNHSPGPTISFVAFAHASTAALEDKEAV
eukprot:CAMPEP_0167818670 /NCGR_PEP_ID=MMETSP0112_2-20121227/4938_1 /TAXON_ID=91324 /ORGANISM="Lotharella globosa, Strain CCCM811" /LENGTH=65 /DNA_ID=CAMNT_0007718689 /DNA_START=305 /DNA_END=503 /DNA_ORIENTATION=-